MARLEIEHIIPVAKGGDSSEANLWLSCPLCNRFKSDRTSAHDPDTGIEVPLFNPRTQRWSEHFRWSDDGIRVLGLTAIGRATVALLHLADDPDALVVRMHWVPPDGIHRATSRSAARTRSGARNGDAVPESLDPPSPTGPKREHRSSTLRIASGAKDRAAGR